MVFNGFVNRHGRLLLFQIFVQSQLFRRPEDFLFPSRQGNVLILQRAEEGGGTFPAPVEQPGKAVPFLPAVPVLQSGKRDAFHRALSVHRQVFGNPEGRFVQGGQFHLPFRRSVRFGYFQIAQPDFQTGFCENPQCSFRFVDFRRVGIKPAVQDDPVRQAIFVQFQNPVCFFPIRNLIAAVEQLLILCAVKPCCFKGFPDVFLPHHLQEQILLAAVLPPDHGPFGNNPRKGFVQLLHLVFDGVFHPVPPGLPVHQRPLRDHGPVFSKEPPGNPLRIHHRCGPGGHLMFRCRRHGRFGFHEHHFRPIRILRFFRSSPVDHFRPARLFLAVQQVALHRRQPDKGFVPLQQFLRRYADGKPACIAFLQGWDGPLPQECLKIRRFGPGQQHQHSRSQYRNPLHVFHTRFSLSSCVKTGRTVPFPSGPFSSQRISAPSLYFRFPRIFLM